MADSRYLSLDVLRGIAILGTLGTNIWIFTHPEGMIGYLTGTPDSDWRAVESGLQLLTQGKFLGLLTVMFGIGLALQQRSALRNGLRWPGTYPWRAALLLLDGVVHFVLMTEFDVLMGYAITGWIVAYLLVTTARTQRRIIVGAAGVHVVLLTVVAVVIAAASRTETEGGPMDPNPYANGSWWDLVVFRLDHALLFRLETLLIFPVSIALFLVGAGLFAAGVLDERGAKLRRRLMVLGFGIALPADVALEFGNPAGLGLLLARYGTAPVVALGILAAVADFYARRPDRAPGYFSRRLAEIGRMALSSYVLQNLVASAICYGWGLGLASALPAQQRVPATVAIYLTVVVVIATFAHLWLRRFDRGPVEWLWNTSYRAVAGTPTGTARGSTRCQSPETHSTTCR
jgi:uncharacterized protein